jgi:phosphoribosylaminoimidazole-succinocarboxamide synthase
MSLLYRGSVKDIHSAAPGTLEFRFSNRYSIFDWGEMPDAIPGKGEALARMGEAFFKKARARGFQTHYVGESPMPGAFRVKHIEVPRGRMEVYQARPVDILIPLEVIFRLGVPKGSSLLRRFPQFREGQRFEQAMIEFSTKLEPMDRMLSEDEALSLSGASPSEWATLRAIALELAQFLRSFCAERGLELWDGKFEFAYGAAVGQEAGGQADRSIVLVDTVGIDELRLTLNGMTVSKEILRQFYQGSSWLQALNRAKAEDSVRFRERTRDHYRENPEPLEEDTLQSVSEMYRLVAELFEAEDPARIAVLRSGLEGVLKTLGGAA